jgi:glycosyltransferase involved in cell wall biosynthesis
MRLAWFSPLPPMGSGIADYSFELAPLLAERADVDVVCPPPGGLRRLRRPPGTRVISPKAFGTRPNEYDAVLYHLGNNPFHGFVYRSALDRPGVAVFHDYVMHHLIAHLMLEDGKDLPRYERLLDEAYGPGHARLVDLRYEGVATEFEKFLFPLNEHVARASTGIVVHNHESAALLAEVAPHVPISVVPHHAGRPPESVAGVDRAEARRRLGLDPDAFLVGHFGYVTRPKQPAAVLGGFARLAAIRPDAQLVLIGSDRTGGGLDLLARRLGIEGRMRAVGYVELPTFYLYLRAVDAVVNLRYPSAGESSGTFARALAEGRPVIVNDLGSFAEVPDDVAPKVDVDGDQAGQVGVHLVRLAEDPAHRAAIEAAARHYASTELDPIRCRDLYLEAAALGATWVSS